MVAFLVPDMAQGKLYRDIESRLAQGSSELENISRAAAADGGEGVEVRFGDLDVFA